MANAIDYPYEEKLVTTQKRIEKFRNNKEEQTIDI